jgi:hypothetical protein
MESCLHAPVLNVIARVRQAPGDYTTLERMYLPKSWNNRLSKSRAVPETESDSDDENNGRLRRKIKPWLI